MTVTVTVNGMFPGKVFAYTVTGEVKVQFYCRCIYIQRRSSCTNAEAAYMSNSTPAQLTVTEAYLPGEAFSQEATTLGTQ